MASMATDVNHGAEYPAVGIRILGMVAEVEARMEPIWLGDCISGYLLFDDDICFPFEMMTASFNERRSRCASEPAT
jgi:hypothetical protein